MIHFKINQEQLNNDLKNIVSSMNSIPSQANINEISRAVGSIAAKESINSLNKEARSNPKQYHHLYEWNQIGKDSSRLVKAQRKISNNSISINFIFKKSKVKVPISSRLTKPNKFGKFVVRSSVFQNKAELIESGRSVSWVAPRNIVFMNKNSIVFRKRGTMMNIKNPGGAAAHGSLERFARRWESGMAAGAVEKSKLLPKLEKDIAKTMSMDKVKSSDIRNCIKLLCDKYDSGTREF